MNYEFVNLLSVLLYQSVKIIFNSGAANPPNIGLRGEKKGAADSCHIFIRHKKIFSENRVSFISRSSTFYIVSL